MYGPCMVYIWLFMAIAMPVAIAMTMVMTMAPGHSHSHSRSYSQQGTTSSRAILFDYEGKPAFVSQQVLIFQY